jgi:AbrB family looped-hinge helix DNA binding protein
MKTKVTIDDFGRLVLPKSIREALGVSGRSSIVIEMVGDKAEMAVATPPRRELTRKGGRTVYAGPLPADWASGDAVRNLRLKRSRHS